MLLTGVFAGDGLPPLALPGRPFLALLGLPPRALPGLVGVGEVAGGVSVVLTGLTVLVPPLKLPLSPTLLLS